MLLIICGEDTAASRRYFLEQQVEYKKKGYFLQSVDATNFVDTLVEESGSMTLFSQPKMYLIENLTRLLGRKSSPKVKALLTQAVSSKEFIILDWESGKSKREITIKEGQIKEFKLPQSIFTLLDSCYPGNLKEFLALFSRLCQQVDSDFIFIMLSRHLRQLIIEVDGGLSSALAPWQRAKIHAQALRWTLTNLTSFYVGMARIDRNIKTGKDALGMQKSIDILASFYLR